MSRKTLVFLGNETHQWLLVRTCAFPAAGSIGGSSASLASDGFPVVSSAAGASPAGESWVSCDASGALFGGLAPSAAAGSFPASAAGCSAEAPSAPSVVSPSAAGSMVTPPSSLPPPSSSAGASAAVRVY